MTSAHDHRLGTDNQNPDLHERERLAFDVHDGPSQSLVAIGLIVRDHLQRADLSPDTRDLLERVATCATESKRQLDELVDNLLLDPVGARGLVDALRDLALRVGDNGGPTVGLCINGDGYALDPDAECALFRVVEGSIVNAWRHGGAHHILVTVRFRPDAVIVRVRDDGAGINGETNDGHGLRGIRRRLGAVGGWLRVVANADRGVTVEAVAPRKPDGVRRNA